MMRKFAYLFGLFLLTAGLAACSSEYDDPPEQPDSHQQEEPTDSIGVNNDTTEIDSTAYTVISAVPVSEEVKAFFDEALPNEKGNPAFTFPTGNENLFYAINSQQDLIDRYIGIKQLPSIDFDKYTLIIGRAYMPGMTYHVESLEIHKYENTQTLCVITDKPEGVFWMAYNMYFWAVFPKFEDDIDRVMIKQQ